MTQNIGLHHNVPHYNVDVWSNFQNFQAYIILHMKFSSLLFEKITTILNFH